jgi:hypothetical protein
VQIADRPCHLVLNYIAAMHRQGVLLTAGDVNSYAKRAERKAKGGWRQMEESMLRGLQGKVQETPLVWLFRVHWIELHGPTEEFADEDVVTISELGQAALRALDQAAVAQSTASSTVVLDDEDPTALARVVEQIMGMGPSALVDRYFSLNVFLAAAQRTKIQRILTGPRPEKRIAGLQQALADVSMDRDFEIRIDESDRYHDRFVIPYAGSVWALGTSMNGIGVRRSIMTEIKGPVADAIRIDFEKAWESGEAVHPNLIQEASTVKGGSDEQPERSKDPAAGSDDGDEGGPAYQQA